MHIVIPDDYPPTYASPEQEDLERLAQHGRVTLHTTRAADRPELFDRLASAEVIINVRAYTALDDEAFFARAGVEDGLDTRDRHGQRGPRRSQAARDHRDEHAGGRGAVGG